MTAMKLILITVCAGFGNAARFRDIEAQSAPSGGKGKLVDVKVGDIAITGSGNMDLPGPAELTLSFRLNGTIVKSTIFMGPQLGRKYTSDFGKEADLHCSDPAGSHYFDWFANKLSSVDMELDTVKELMKSTVSDVISGFHLNTSADAFMSAFNQGVSACKSKDSCEKAAAAFNAATDRLVPRADLPNEIVNDPWMIEQCKYRRKAWLKGEIALGFGEYVIQVMVLQHIASRMLQADINALKRKGVKTVVSLVEFRQFLQLHGKFEEPLGTGLRRGNPLSADNLFRVADLEENRSHHDLEDKLRQATGAESGSVFAIAPEIKQQNQLTTALKEHGDINHEWLAFEDFTVPLSAWTETFQNVIYNTLLPSLQSGHNVYLHCNGGFGRTGIIAAVLLMEATGMYWRDAIQTIRMVRPKAVETPQQEMYVVRYWRNTLKAKKLSPLDSAKAWEPAGNTVHYGPTSSVSKDWSDAAVNTAAKDTPLNVALSEEKKLLAKAFGLFGVTAN